MTSTSQLQPPRVPMSDRLSGTLTARVPGLLHALGNVETRVLRDVITGVSIDRPVYVCGLARSGTTVLLDMLASAEGFTSHRYSDYAMLWTPYWWNALRARLPLPAQPPVERAHRDRLRVTADSPEAFEETLWMHFFEGRHEPSVDQVLARDCDNAAFEAFYTAHIRKLLAVRRARYYVAKANYNLTRMGYLLRLFPDARFIVAVREPLAHVASLVKQDRLFTRWSRLDPNVAQHLQRVGHFEFGPHKRAVNVGDAGQAAAIQACFAAGNAVEGYARQWAATYGWLMAQLAVDTTLARACLVVPYESLCGNSAETLAAVFAHAGVNAGQADGLVRRYASRLSLPDYYVSDLDSGQRESVMTIVKKTWQNVEARSRLTSGMVKQG